MMDKQLSQNELQNQHLHMFGQNSMLVLYTLGEGNPGAYTVVSKLYQLIEEDHIMYDNVIGFIQNLLLKKITGARLWYIYKNESNFDVKTLIQLNLEQFTTEYFFEKFEKYL